LFSDEFDKAFQLLLETKSDILNEASIDNLKNHITAAYIELLNITFAKNRVSRDKRYEIGILKDEYIKSQNGTAILDLLDDYNREFGSSMVDGIRPMANYFSSSIKTSRKKDLEDFAYNLFYAVLNDSFKEIKGIKLV